MDEPAVKQNLFIRPPPRSGFVIFLIYDEILVKQLPDKIFLGGGKYARLLSYGCTILLMITRKYHDYTLLAAFFTNFMLPHAPK